LSELDIADEMLKKAQGDAEKNKFKDIIKFLEEKNVPRFKGLVQSTNMNQQNTVDLYRMSLLLQANPLTFIPTLGRPVASNINTLNVNAPLPQVSSAPNINLVKIAEELALKVTKLEKLNKSLVEESLNLKRKVDSLEKSKTKQDKETNNLKRKLTTLEQNFDLLLNRNQTSPLSTQTSGQPLPTTRLSNCNVITESKMDAKQALTLLASNVNPTPSQNESSKEKEGEKSKKVTEEREKSMSNSKKRGRGE
jgi:hypothetical protein